MLRRKTRLNPISKRRAKEKAEYEAIKRKWMRDHPTCEIGPIIKNAGYPVACRVRTTSIHHVRGRVGRMLCDTRYWLSSCSGECHPRWVHQTHKDIALQLGLLQPNKTND